MKKKIHFFVILIVASFFIGSFVFDLRSADAQHDLEPAADLHEVHLPIIARPPEMNAFGVESNVALTHSTYKQRIEELGVRWTRINRTISWRNLQPVEGGPINWDLLTGFDAELRTLRELGIKPIVVVDDYPAWATIVPNSCSPLQADKFDDFARFVVQLVDRYKVYEYNLKDWELGNEVDVDPRLIGVDSIFGCWGDIDDLAYYGGDYYGEMVKVVGQAIKAADPSARVWLGGLMVASPNTTDPAHGKPENFLRGVLAVGAAPYFDVIPYHGHMSYYGNMQDIDSLKQGGWAPWGGGAVGKPRFIRSIMQAYGVDKVLSLDEVGIGCVDTYDFCQEPVPEFYQFQANMVVRYAVRVMGERVESFVWYTLNSPSWREMGLVYDDKSPRPVFHAYQNMADQIGGLTYVSMINYGNGVEAHEFSGNGKKVQVIWTDIDQFINLSIPSEKLQAAYDRDGNPISVTNFVVTVGFSPIYLVYAP